MMKRGNHNANKGDFSEQGQLLYANSALYTMEKAETWES